MGSNANRWTKEHLDFLIENYGKITQEEIGKRLNHTTNSVKFKAWKLRKKGVNLHSELDHSEEQIEKMSEKKARHLIESAYTLTPELAYIIGVLVGDGYLGKMRIGLTTRDLDFANYFKEKLEKWSGLNANLYKYNSDGYKQGFYYSVFLNSRRVVKFLFPFYVSQLNEEAIKNIKIFLDKNKECQIKFIEGFFDSEGSVRKYNRIALDNSNKQLIDYVSELLNNFEINHKIYFEKKHKFLFIDKNKKKTYSKRLDMYRISIQIKEEIIKFCNLFNSSIKEKKDRMNDKLKKYS